MTLLNYCIVDFVLRVYNRVAMLERIKKDPVFFISGILAIVSCFFVTPNAKYLEYIDFRVLAILFCMMLVVKAFQIVVANGIYKPGTILGTLCHHII